MDLQRTMPTIGNFSRGGDLEAPLRNVLLAYAHTRPHLSYVQGMSHLAAALLLVMPPPRAWCAREEAIAVGMMLGAVTMYTNNLLSAIVAHVLTNSLSGIIWKWKQAKIVL